MNFEMENGKYRYINSSSNKILFVQEQSLSLDKTSESKVLIHEYVNFFLLWALMIIHFIFSDVQSTIYEKVKFWSGRIFSN